VRRCKEKEQKQQRERREEGKNVRSRATSEGGSGGFLRLEEDEKILVIGEDDGGKTDGRMGETREEKGVVGVQNRN